jgi:hypothetical protein
MFNGRRSPMSLIQAAHRWRPFAKRLATAAAASGEPATLLAPEGVELQQKPVDLVAMSTRLARVEPDGQPVPPSDAAA